MRLTVEVEGDDVNAARSLRDWLRRGRDLSGGIQEVPENPNMGSLPGSLIVTVAGTDALHQLVLAVTQWIRARQGGAVRISRAGWVVTVDSSTDPDSLHDVVAALASPPPGPDFPTDR